MVAFFKRGEKKQKIMRQSIVSWNNRALATYRMSNGSPESMNITKHVVIVMDGMKEFTTEPLEWALENVINAGSTVTLLGVMPWLNIPREYCDSSLLNPLIFSICIYE